MADWEDCTKRFTIGKVDGGKSLAASGSMRQEYAPHNGLVIRANKHKETLGPNKTSEISTSSRTKPSWNSWQPARRETNRSKEEKEASRGKRAGARPEATKQY